MSSNRCLKTCGAFILAILCRQNGGNFLQNGPNTNAYYKWLIIKIVNIIKVAVNIHQNDCRSSFLHVFSHNIFINNHPTKIDDIKETFRN